MESELLALIDQLEALLESSGKVPISGRIMVPGPDAYRLLDQMRQALPREVVRARHIYQERDRLLQEARIEADGIRASATAEHDALLAQHTITIEAIRAAEQVKRDARAESERLRLEADAYALHSLRDLQVQLMHLRAALDATLKTAVGGVEHLESHTHHALP